MTDRELLELAAKAAGLKHVDYSGIDYDGRLGIVLVDEIGRHCSDWNPLADDGDALRLAVKLEIDIFFGANYVIARGSVQMPTVNNTNDPDAATRRAIVRAAAALGEKMP